MKDLHTLKKLLFQIFHILNKRQRFQMLGMFFVILVGSLFEMLGVSAMLPFIQSIMNPIELMKKPFVGFACNLLGINNPSAVILLVGVGIILIYIIKNSYLSVSAYLQAAYSSQTYRDLAVLMLKSYMERPYSFFVNGETGVIMNGVLSDTYGVFVVMQNGFKLLTELLVIISMAVYLLATDMILALGVLLVGFLCLLLVVFGLKKRISEISSLARDANQQQYNWIAQITGGIKDILVYGRQKLFLNKYKKAADNYCKASTQNSFIAAIPERVIEAFCVSGIIVTILIRIRMGVSAEDFVPKMAVFAMGAFRLLPSISRSTGYISALVYYREWVESTYENVVAAESTAKEGNSRLEISEVDIARWSAIVLDDIHWRYTEEKDLVLQGLSMKIHKGEALGIIGESGSGKSTLADILLRLYHPQKGEIFLDGTNIESIPLKWSSLIGYVPQTVFLMDDTIRNNITFGLETSDDNKVWSVLKMASLDKFVKELPDGLSTFVGERGVKFSGGQRQRIAIARALYNDPQILILDEATSALDNDTEETVMDAIDALSGRVTLIIIAHRLTTLKGCNKIYEIVNGHAVERNKLDIVD